MTITKTEVKTQFATQWRYDVNGQPFGMVSKEKARRGEQTFFICTTLAGRSCSIATKQGAFNWMKYAAENQYR